MTPAENEQLPENPRGSVAVSLFGQLFGLGIALVLFWLHSGGDFSHLGSPLDTGYLLVAGCWLACWLAISLWAPRRAHDRPYLVHLLCLLPALIATGAACLYAGMVPQTPDGRGNCDLLYVSAFWAERLRFAGLLASGSMWWGVLVAQLLSTEKPEVEDKTFEPENLRWPWVVAGLLFAGSVVLSFLDPVMPSRAKVGGPEVRGLWVLVAGAVVLWMWAHFMSMLSERRTRFGALWGSLAACLGLLLMGMALIAFERSNTFYGLAYEAARFQWGEDDAGPVTATALLRTAPFLLVAVLIALGIGLRRLQAAQRRWSLLLVVMILAGAGLFAGYEAGWRNMYAGRCQGVLPEGIELPCTVASQEPREGSLLVVGQENAWLDGNHVIEKDDLELNPVSAADRGEPLNLAVDRRVKFRRLHRFLMAAGKTGWNRFRLLVREPDGAGCQAELRVFGVCLSEQISNLFANAFEIPHFGRQSGRPVAPPEGVVANVIVETDRLEVSFGGFTAAGEDLDSMAASLPDRMGVRDLASLVQVLTRAKERYPDSNRLILVVHDDLPVDQLAGLIAVVHGQNPPQLFPNLTVSRLVR